jgi:hypothetical protein
LGFDPKLGLDFIECAKKENGVMPDLKTQIEKLKEAYNEKDLDAAKAAILEIISIMKQIITSAKKCPGKVDAEALKDELDQV